MSCRAATDGWWFRFSGKVKTYTSRAKQKKAGARRESGMREQKTWWWLGWFIYSKIARQNEPVLPAPLGGVLVVFCCEHLTAGTVCLRESQVAIVEWMMNDYNLKDHLSAFFLVLMTIILNFCFIFSRYFWKMEYKRSRDWINFFFFWGWHLVWLAN